MALIGWQFKDRLIASTLKQVARERLSQPKKFQSTYIPAYSVNHSPGSQVLYPARQLPALRGHVAIPLETIPAARKIDIGGGFFEVLVGSGLACIYKRDQTRPGNPLIAQRDFDSGEQYIATVYNLSPDPILAGVPPIREFEGEEPPPQSCGIDCDDPLLFVTQDMNGDLYVTYKEDFPCDTGSSSSGFASSGESGSSVFREPSKSEGSDGFPSDGTEGSDTEGSDSFPSESGPSEPSGSPPSGSEPSGSQPSEPSGPSEPSDSPPSDGGSESSSGSPPEPSGSGSGSPPEPPSGSSSSEGDDSGKSGSSGSGEGSASGSGSATEGSGSISVSGSGGVCVDGIGGLLFDDMEACDPDSFTGILGIDENGCLCMTTPEDFCRMVNNCISTGSGGSGGSGSVSSSSGSDISGGLST